MNNFRRGTPAFGFFLGAAFLICGALIMWIGFWRTLLLAALFALGYFLGAVKDQKGFVRQVVNQVVPEKEETAIDFRREIERDQESRFSTQAEAEDKKKDGKEE